MAGWDEGYISDIAYTSGFYREMLPANIAFAAISVGRHPGRVLNPERVLDLGFGMGFGLVLAAAAHPGTHFEGIDFNPLHVAHAQALADASGITNISVAEASFQEMAERTQEGQQDLDLILLHGIMSWVSDDARAAIVEIARKRLRPGGLLYVSYNSMPGSAAVVPLQHLVIQNAKRLSGRSDQKARAGLQLIETLRKEGMRYPVDEQFVDGLLKQDRTYLAHEYLNSHWKVFNFSELATMMDGAKLDYVGSATLIENVERLSVPEGLRDRIRNEADPVFRETLRDLASNKSFRRDIFGRGTASLNAAERDALLQQFRFFLLTPRSQVKFQFSLPVGKMDLKQGLYDRIYDLMADKPASFADIAAQFETNNVAAAFDALSVQINRGQVAAVYVGPGDGADMDAEPARRFNREICARALLGRSNRYLASARATTGLPATGHELLMLQSIFENGKQDVATITRYVIDAMKAADLIWTHKDKDVTDPAELKKLVGAAVEAFVSTKLPLWRYHQAF